MKKNEKPKWEKSMESDTSIRLIKVAGSKSSRKLSESEFSSLPPMAKEEILEQTLEAAKEVQRRSS